MAQEKTSSWTKIERLVVLITLLGGVAALLSLFFQIKSKKIQAEFQIVSLDYLTTNNNIDGLNSNYEYRGESVKNLWLLKIKLINTGDVTLIGKGKNSNLLDSFILFRFDKGVEILDNVKAIQSDFPQRLYRSDSNALAISFDQWRESEAAVYSIYLKSENKDINYTQK